VCFEGQTSPVSSHLLVADEWANASSRSYVASCSLSMIERSPNAQTQTVRQNRSPMSETRLQRCQQSVKRWASTRLAVWRIKYCAHDFVSLRLYFNRMIIGSSLVRSCEWKVSSILSRKITHTICLRNWLLTVGFPVNPQSSRPWNV
jgi:hypothetical protein